MLRFNNRDSDYFQEKRESTKIAYKKNNKKQQ